VKNIQQVAKIIRQFPEVLNEQSPCCGVGKLDFETNVSCLVGRGDEVLGHGVAKHGELLEV